MLSFTTLVYIVVILIILLPWTFVLDILPEFYTTFILIPILAVALGLLSLKLFIIYRGQVGKTYFIVIMIQSILLIVSGVLYLIS